MKAIIKMRMVGMHFGTVGVLYSAGRGRRLGETRVYPYGFDFAAREGAEQLAAELGLEVAS